jgi:hypothetical protein
MNADLLEQFAAAVRAAREIPEGVREAANDAVGVEVHTFDHTYLEFLEQQIELAPRGPEWAERLKKRRDGLSHFCDHPLIRGWIDLNRDSYSIEVDPKTGTVVYWEEYKDWKDGSG